MVEEGQVIQSSEDGPTELRKTKVERMYGPARVPMQMEDTSNYQETKTVARSYNFIWFIVGIIEALLGFRFVFEMAGANPGSPFVQFIYAVSYPFSQPFHSIFGVTVVANSFFDWSLLVAIMVYWLIGFGLVQLLRIMHPVTTDHVRHRVRTV
jgi:uncharacterized protein YggT (Ycf19 family)